MQSHPAARGIRSTLIGMAFNIALAAIKISAGVIGNAYALVADGIESLSDVFSSFVVYLGLRIAILPPDESHPYGHGKAEPIAAIIVGGALLGASGLIAWESVQEIRTPHTAPAGWTLIVLAAVMAVKEVLYRYVAGVGRQLESTAISTDAWHHRSDAITSACAFAGITVALIGGPGWEGADDWAALFASLIITINALRLLGPAIAEITDMAPRPDIRDEVRRIARGIGGVIDVEKCLVRKMGLDYYVDMHVIVDPEMTVRDGHAIAHQVKDAVREANPRVSDVLVHVEPEGWHRL